MNNRNIVFKVVNPSESNATIASPQTGAFGGSRLASYFHWLMPQSTTPVIATTQFPAPGAMPGASYLQPFGFNSGGH
jgi:hypothetical protein